MNSKYIKACLSAYFRFGKSIELMATEAGKYNSDFLVIYKGRLIEIEIKTSKSDFNADSKKLKHKIYESGRSYWTPNEFYFAVPDSLVEHAVTKCIGKKYGVLRVIDNRKLQWMQRVRVVKRAQKLVTRPVDPKVRYTMLRRLLSEMANLRINEQIELLKKSDNIL